MRTPDRSEVVTFGVQLGRNFPGLPGCDVEDMAKGLMQCARSLAAGNLRRCNESMDEAAEVRFEKRMDVLESRARQAAEALGTQVVTNRDPRGYSLYLVLPSGNMGGDWGGRGYPVPEV